jgi:uncharacterized protein YecT (DUF1311 family)
MLKASMAPRRALAPTLALLFAVSGQACVASPAPPSLQGHWEVIQVAVDEADQPHWRYEPGDPRLLGRLLSITADGAVAFDFGKSPCSPVDWVARPAAPLAALVGKSFPRPAQADRRKTPTLQDFGLATGDKTVIAYDATCPASSKTGTSPAHWNQAWFAALGTDRLIAAYGGDTVLLVGRADPTHVAPSFSCKAAASPTEKAICGSPALAGYDRSVAAAYRRSLQRHADDKSTVENGQREWLATRNACKSDTSCISDRLQERLDLLMQD